jgi:hypothetical protein
VVRLVIDYENTASTWWESGGRALWDALVGGLEKDAVVEESVAISWLEQAAKIEGWEDGPEHAPHPVRMVEVDPDEPV